MWKAWDAVFTMMLPAYPCSGKVKGALRAVDAHRSFPRSRGLGDEARPGGTPPGAIKEVAVDVSCTVGVAGDARDGRRAFVRQWHGHQTMERAVAR